jgi:hypothetical protein
MIFLKQISDNFISSWRTHFAFRIYVFLVFAAALIQCFKGVLLVDSVEYINAGKNMGEFRSWDCCYKGQLCDVFLHQTRRTPGYPFYLLLSGGGCFARLFQIIPALLVPLLSLQLLSHFSNSRKAAQLLMWLFVFYPLQFYYTSLIMPEIWVQFFLLLLALNLIQKKYAAGVVYATALAAFKPVFLPFLFLSVLLFSLLAKWQKSVLLLPLCAYLFIGLVNKKQTGVFHFTSIATVNAWDYNARAVINRNVNSLQASQFMGYHDSIARTMRFDSGMKYLSQQTQNVIFSNLITYAFLHIRGCLITLIDPGRYDFIAWWQLPEGKGLMGIKGGHGLSAFFSQPPLYLTYIFVFLFLSILKVLCALRGLFFNMQYQQVWILFVLFAIPLAMVGPVGSARYLMPVAPILFIFCALGLKKANKTAHENSAH